MKTIKSNNALEVVYLVRFFLNKLILLTVLCFGNQIAYSQINIARNKKATASMSHPSAPANHAIDQNLSTAWNAGRGAPQWISIDLQGQYDISKIRLNPAISPQGNTTQEILVSTDLSVWKSIEVFTLMTRSNSPIERNYDTLLKNIKGVRVLTSQSPSWISWLEIEIIGSPHTPVNKSIETAMDKNNIDDKHVNLTIPFNKEFTSIDKPDFSKYQILEIKKYAKRGDIASLVTYGDMHYYGFDKIRQNEAEAILYYRKAADLGNAMSQYKLASIYRQNIATVSDAVKYYNLAVEQNYEPAIFDLATIYLNGNVGIPKDYSKAKELFQKLPSNMKAKTELGKLYLSSDIKTFGLKADLRTAKTLFQEAGQIRIFNEWLGRLENFGQFRNALTQLPTLFSDVNIDIDYKNESQLRLLIDQLVLQSDILGKEKVRKFTFELIDNIDVVNSTISEQYEYEAFQSAIKSKSPIILMKFINRFPNSTHRKFVLDEITNLDNEKYATAKRHNIIYAYKQYLEAFPLGLNSADAKAKIQQLEREEKVALEKQLEADRVAILNAQRDEINAKIRREELRKSSIINAKIGDRLCFVQGWKHTLHDPGFFGLFSSTKTTNYTMSIICFIENINGENYQIRIADVTSSNEKNYSSPNINGVRVNKGDVIWVKPINDLDWYKCD